MAFTFHECEPSQWTGRYRRIPGAHAVFHVRANDVVDIVDGRNGDTVVCIAEPNDAAIRLAKAVNRVKRQRTGRAGGSFVINEYGQVICPVADESCVRFHVGDCEGELAFRWPDGGRFTLGDDRGLKTGDDWRLPYVGIPFSLSHAGRIYFPMREGSDTECVYPVSQDYALIRRLRAVRPFGGVRFLVNPSGVVLTKVEVSAFDWRPKYVGRIDMARWFAREA